MSVSRELVRAVQIMVIREDKGEHVPEGWEQWTEDEVITLAATPAGTFYVNVYQLDRSYGGAEEGGWWFDSGDVELSIVCDSRESALERAEMLREIYANHGNRYSVNYHRKAPDYDVMVSEKPAADWSDYEPYS